MESLEGKMEGTQCPDNVSTKLQRIANKAKESPKVAFTNLAHHIDVEFLREAYKQTRKGGAVGVDGQTADAYAERLDANLMVLHDVFKSGEYKAPPVRRIHIPKGDGRKTRPIGIPTFEDKVLQKAVVMVLEQIYEQDFMECSYGFRPGRSALQAAYALREKMMEMGGGWVIELDIQDFFGSLDHKQLRLILERRVRDGVMRRVIDKWLKAGAMEEGRLIRSEAGSPQGGVVSPIMANAFLHEVMDMWFESEVKPRLQGHAFMMRYCDDMVAVFSHEDDARKVMRVLPKRFGKYGLSLHPEKTRLTRFKRPAAKGGGRENSSFDFLGFRFYWSRSRNGYWVIQRKTSSDRLKRAVKAVYQWCRRNRHEPMKEQRAMLALKLRGHYGYYGVTGNFASLAAFRRRAGEAWFKWLNRRSQKKHISWNQFVDILLPGLPKARIVHSYLSAKP
jgi:RNA-directed DNA polymerase